MENIDFLATQMTQTYFMMLPNEEKVKLAANYNLYTEKYIKVYEACKREIITEKERNVMKPFGEDENSLSDRIFK